MTHTIHKYLITISLFLSLLKLNGQDSVRIADANFASYLCANFPSISNASCSNFKRELNSPFIVDGVVDISSRNIESIIEIDNFRGIDRLIANNNKISDDLVFSSNDLNFVDLGFNELTSIPEFQTTNTVQEIELRLNNNRISSFSTIEPLAGKLISITLENNLLEELPSFENFIKLDTINVEFNYLTFEDLLKIKEYPVSTQLKTTRYFPQRDIILPDTVSEELGADYTFTLPVDANVTNNTYKWYKNNALLSTTNTNQLNLGTLAMADSGNYRVEITNTRFDNIGGQINSETFFLEVLEPEPEFNEALLQFNAEPGCNDFSLTVDVNSIQDGYTISIKDIEGTFYTIEELEDTRLNLGVYDLVASSPRGRVTTIENWLSQTQNKDCSSVITPNGDGNQDNLYLEGNGEAEVINSAGQCIIEIKLPGVWDGRDSNGNLVKSGLYFIQMNGSEILEVSILK